MARFTLSRRTVLRGAAGAAVALPPLEIMAPRHARAVAASIPSRFVQTFTGVSLGADGSELDTYLVVPKTTGASYVPSRALRPVEGGAAWKVGGETYASVRAHVGMVSGLAIPVASGDGPAGPGGRIYNQSFHGTSTAPQTSGQGNRVGEVYDGPGGKGSTCDQLVADAIKGTTPLPSIYVRVQPNVYYTNNGGVNNGGEDGHISFRSGRMQQATVSLREAYNTLFSAGGMVNGRTFDVAAYIDRRKSILDVVRDKSTQLLARLGGDDRMRIEQYYQQIRDLETSLDGIKAKSGTMACKPPMPPADPPIADGFIGQEARDPNFRYTADRGWSNEELRAQVMVDFVHLALACDLTRSALLHLTIRQCYMNGYHIIPSQKNFDLHTIGHGAGDMNDVADVIGWHVKHFSRLVAKLRDTVEVDGTPLIDHSALFMLFEGGYGNGSTGSDNGEIMIVKNTHSTENMVVIVAGGAGGLKAGQHIQFKNNRHPAQVVLTAMNAVGVQGPLGDIKDPIPELFQPGT